MWNVCFSVSNWFGVPSLYGYRRGTKRQDFDNPEVTCSNASVSRFLKVAVLFVFVNSLARAPVEVL